jgi:hypothetical protein
VRSYGNRRVGRAIGLANRRVPIPLLLLLAGFAGAAPAALGAPAKVLGPNKCTSCHDHEKQAAWAPKDTHAKALQQLEDKNASKYAKAIGLADPYDLKGSCVGCHATVFNGDANAGVSCETCHGAGSDYVDPHQQKGNYAKAVSLGMFDTRGNLQIWAKMCMDCHVMRDAKLIASGHKSGADFDAGAGSQKIVHWAPTYDFAKISALGKAAGGKPAGGAAAPAPAAPAAAPAAAPPAPKPTAAPPPAAAPAPAPAPTAKPAPQAAEPPAAAKPAQPSPVPARPTPAAPTPEVKKPTSPPAPPPPTAVPPPPPTAVVAAPAPAAVVPKAPSPTSEIPITIEASPIPTRVVAPRHTEAPPAPRAVEAAPATSVEPARAAPAAPSAPKPKPTARRPYKKKVLTHVTPQAPAQAESQPTSQPAPTVTPTRRPASQAPPVRAPH